jgi:hypothetical protein
MGELFTGFSPPIVGIYLKCGLGKDSLGWGNVTEKNVNFIDSVA